MDGQWVKDFPAAITVCDPTGKIIEMNEKSRLMFRKDGGSNLWQEPARLPSKRCPAANRGNAAGTKTQLLHHRKERSEKARRPVPLL